MRAWDESKVRPVTGFCAMILSYGRHVLYNWAEEKFDMFSDTRHSFAGVLFTSTEKIITLKSSWVDVDKISLVTNYLSLEHCRIMATPNFTEGGARTETLEERLCSPALSAGIHQQHLISLSAVNIFLSITAFLGNSLIIVALQKESSLHPPSKLLYRCLATTDLCVGLVTQPINAGYLMSLAHKDWSLCRYFLDTAFITGTTLSLVSLLTVTSISIDRLLALHFLGILSSVLPVTRNLSLHPPSKLLYRCLATTDLCVALVCQPLSVTVWMSTAIRKFDCSLYQYLDDASFITSYILGSVSLLTLSAISVDRLLALSLGLRYRQVVTLERKYLVVVTFWVVSSVASALHLADKRITLWYGYIGIPLCLATSIASYTKVFLALRHHHAQVQDHVQQQPSQSTALNIARYRKAVYSALWVQLALVVCYLPYSIATVLAGTDRGSPHCVTWVITVTLVYFNSSLNPFLYCWKITEVRQAVKETIREALCCPWS